MRRGLVSVAAVVGLAAVAIGGAAIAQVRERTPRAPQDLQPDLSVSVGLGCVVYLRMPPEGPGSIASPVNGLSRDRSRAVRLEGTLTGASSSAITVRSDDRVYWVNLAEVSVVEFQTK